MLPSRPLTSMRPPCLPSSRPVARPGQRQPTPRRVESPGDKRAAGGSESPAESAPFGGMLVRPGHGWGCILPRNSREGSKTGLRGTRDPACFDVASRRGHHVRKAPPGWNCFLFLVYGSFLLSVYECHPQPGKRRRQPSAAAELLDPSSP